MDNAIPICSSGRVALDIGNVLIHVDIWKFIAEISRRFGLSDHDAYFFLETIQPLQDLNITTVARSLKTTFRIADEDISKLIEVWNSTVWISEPMMSWLNILRSEDIKIALLSNMGPGHLAYLRTNYPDLFKDTIQHISCEVGARKPSRLFFQSFILDHDAFRGCVYLDDLEENLRASKSYGFQTYNFNLSTFNTSSLSAQKRELDKIKSFILNRS